MKTLFSLLTVCLLAACAGGKRPPTRPAKGPPKAEHAYRLVFENPPYSADAPQVGQIPSEGDEALAAVRADLATSAAEYTEYPEPAKLPVPYVYHLQGAEGGSWQTLGLVDSLGRFVKVEKGQRGLTLASRFTDARATRILREQIETMALERDAHDQPADPDAGPAAPVEGIPIELRKGYMRSPFDPQGRPIDVRGLSKGTVVEDPYNPERNLLVP